MDPWGQSPLGSWVGEMAKHSYKNGPGEPREMVSLRVSPGPP